MHDFYFFLFFFQREVSKRSPSRQSSKVNERFKNDLENKLENPEMSDGSIFRLIEKTLIPKTPFIDGNYESVASVHEYHRIIEVAQGKK